jgi:GTP-binding protein HflX
MKGYQVVNDNQESAFLVGVSTKGSHPLFRTEDSLHELALLAKTAGMQVAGQVSQQLDRIDPATFIGSGKLEEIKSQVAGLGIKTIIFDDELSPRHQRELEKQFGETVKVLDRSALILDIFAQHAKTREGALQVELAQYEYRLPRLTRQWTHLARQAGGGSARGGTGGVGLRGPGETQLEVDRREIGRRITKLKSELEDVRAHRNRHRAQRIRARIPVVSLVGYTNAGKSTLFQALTGSDVYIADQLFATLDPLTRRISLPSGRQILLTDTVGFIQKLPTTLIAAFRATLEEVASADVILHVVDATHPNMLQHIEAVEDTLAEIEVPGVPRILVWNKIDLLEGELADTALPDRTYVGSAQVSALRHKGIDNLLEVIESAVARSHYLVTLRLPYDRGDLLSQIYETATVESSQHTEDGVIIEAFMSPEVFDRYKTYQI